MCVGLSVTLFAFSIKFRFSAVRPGQLQGHANWHVRERNFGRRAETLVLCLGNIDGSVANVLRRAHFRPGLLHGPERGSDAEAINGQRQDGHNDHSSTVVRNFQFVRQDSAAGRGQIGLHRLANRSAIFL